MQKILGTLVLFLSFYLLFFPIGPMAEWISDQFLTWASYPYTPTQSTRGWLLVDLESTLKVWAGYMLLIGYGLFVYQKPQGRSEKPTSPMLKSMIIVYNLSQCVLCCYMIWGAMKEYIAQGYSVSCNEFHPERQGMAAAVHVFYLSKVFDFFDTVFMIARGSWSQFTFLHVYHHSSVFLIFWMNINSGYDGDIYVTVTFNSFVHLVMYFYYFLTTINIKPPWKNFVTILQLVQFVSMIVQGVSTFIFTCPYPRHIVYVYLSYVGSLLILFLNFYIQTYIRGGSRPSKPVGKKSE